MPATLESRLASGPAADGLPAAWPSSRGSLSWTALAAGTWMFGTLLILGRLVLGLLAVQWMVRHTQEATGAAWLPLAQLIAAPRTRTPCWVVFH